MNNSRILRTILFLLALMPLTATVYSKNPVVKFVDKFDNANHPQILYWFWDDATIKDKQYLKDIDKIAEKSPFDMVMLTSRFVDSVGFWNTQRLKPHLAEAVDYAHKRGVKIVLQLWPLNRTRELTLSDYPIKTKDAEALITEKECTLNGSGNATETLRSISSDKNKIIHAELFKVWLFRKTADGFYEASTLVEARPEWLSASVKDRFAVQVSIHAPEKYAGYTACILTKSYYNYFDVLSPEHFGIFKTMLDGYAHIPFDGTALDENGNIGLYSRTYWKNSGAPMDERTWCDEFESHLRRAGIDDPARLLFDMRYAPENRPEVRIKAINHYFEERMKGPLGVENAFYDYSKKLFGKDAFIGCHSTFHNAIDGLDVWTTGVDWWDLPREYGQTDEGQPMPDRMGIGMSGSQPVMYNMFYNRNKEIMFSEAIDRAAFGVREHYHAWNDVQGWGKDVRDDDFLTDLAGVEQRVRLLNRFNPAPPRLPVLLIYGFPYQFNWFPDVSEKGWFSVREIGEGMHLLANRVWNAGYPCAAIPSTWLERGMASVRKDGKVQVKDRVFDAVVYLYPQYSKPSALKFMKNLLDAKGKLMIAGNATRDFDGNECAGQYREIADRAIPFDVENLDRIAAKNPVAGGTYLQDGSVVLSDYASVRDKTNKDFSVKIGNNEFSGTFEGVFALKADKKGLIEKMVCGNFKSLKRNGKTILELKYPADICISTENGKQLITVKGNNEVLIPPAAHPVTSNTFNDLGNNTFRVTFNTTNGLPVQYAYSDGSVTKGWDGVTQVTAHVRDVKAKKNSHGIKDPAGLDVTCTGVSIDNNRGEALAHYSIPDKNIAFDVKYALAGDDPKTSLQLTLENVTEDPVNGHVLLRLNLPSLVTINDSDKDWLAHANGGGVWSMLSDAKETELALSNDGGRFEHPNFYQFPLVLMGGSKMTCAMEVQGFQTNTAIKVFSDNGVKTATMGAYPEHYVTEGVVAPRITTWGHKLPPNGKPSLEDEGYFHIVNNKIPIPILKVEQKEICRLDFTRDYDGNGKVDWLDAGKRVAERMPARNTDYFNDRIIYILSATTGPAETKPIPDYTLAETQILGIKLSNLIDGNPSVLAISGWPHGGHDSSYPNHNFNENLLPEGTANPEGEFVKAKEALKDYGITLTFDDNWDDQYDNQYTKGNYDSHYITRNNDGTLRIYDIWNDALKWEQNTNREDYRMHVTSFAKYMNGIPGYTQGTAPGMQRVEDMMNWYRLEGGLLIDALTHWVIRNDFDPAAPASAYKNLVDGKFKLLEEFANRGVYIGSEILHYPFIYSKLGWCVDGPLSGNIWKGFGGTEIPLLNLVLRNTVIYGGEGGNMDYGVKTAENLFFGNRGTRWWMKGSTTEQHFTDLYYHHYLPWMATDGLEITGFKREGKVETIVFEGVNRNRLGGPVKNKKVTLTLNDRSACKMVENCNNQGEVTIFTNDELTYQMDENRIAFYSKHNGQLKYPLPAGKKAGELAVYRLTPEGRIPYSAYSVSDGNIIVDAIAQTPVIVDLKGGILSQPAPPLSKINPKWDLQKESVVNVSHSIGIPFGGIGTGFSVYGKYGFSRVHFHAYPNEKKFSDGRPNKAYTENKEWNYEKEPVAEAPFAFTVEEGNKRYVLQENVPAWLNTAQPVDRMQSWAFLPKALFDIENSWGLGISINAFSPMIPHDLANSTVPAQIFDVTLRNERPETRELCLRFQTNRQALAKGNRIEIQDEQGCVAVSCSKGIANETGLGFSISLPPGAKKTVRFVIAWYYPTFRTPSPNAKDLYTRYYTKAFPDAAAVLKYAEKHADGWLQQIDRWHDSYNVPGYFKKLWFSSLSSVITSTILSDNPYFFEIETPHLWVNTMDVSVYSSWLYMVNWPELERMDMEQHFTAIPTQGTQAGIVRHDLWTGGANYVEEPIFPGRVYRDYLWFNDKKFLEASFEKCELALNQVYNRGHYGFLVSSVDGNQSYDCWKMPGASAYVNSAWIFSLYAMERMSKILGKPAHVAGIPVEDFKKKAFADFNKLLWNDKEGYWNCFYRTPDASAGSVPETSFLDQLFGLWLLLLDEGAKNQLSGEQVKSALDALYANNLVVDEAQAFRGWANGMLPGQMPDMESGYHVRTSWICAQTDLGSLLGAYGQEDKSIDVFTSLESSLHNNHLAVGEWNKSVTKDKKSSILPEEPDKDTPRFPAYPRYKCVWEYLSRILGLTLDREQLYLNPFKSFAFSLENITLAGVRLTVVVEKDWNTVWVNGKKIGEVENGRLDPVGISRGKGFPRVEFRKIGEV